MAKKKRKTRKEKEMIKTHSFRQNKTIAPTITATKREETGDKNERLSNSNKSNVPDYIKKDLKKVTIITGLIIAIVVIIWVLAYHTNLLDPLFLKLQIKY